MMVGESVMHYDAPRVMRWAWCVEVVHRRWFRRSFRLYQTRPDQRLQSRGPNSWTCVLVRSLAPTPGSRLVGSWHFRFSLCRRLWTVTERPKRLVTFQTFDQADEAIWPDQKKTYLPFLKKTLQEAYQTQSTESVTWVNLSAKIISNRFQSEKWSSSNLKQI